MVTASPLNIALTGLRVAQSQIAVASGNIANVSTDGYTRKHLNQYSATLGSEGAGAAVGLVERRINEILVKDYRKQISTATGLQTTSAYLDKVQELQGTPDSEQSISAYVGRLKDSFVQLANAPENAFALTSVYSQAQQIVSKFKNLSDSILQMRNNAQSEMKQSVDKVNALTSQIAELNKAIKTAVSQLRSTADLEDQRDLAIRNLAEEMDVTTFKDQTGVVSVMTRNGQVLADIDQTKLYFDPVALGNGNYYPATAAAIRLGNPMTGTDITTDSTLGGRLGALRTLRDETLPTYSAQLDELSHKMAMRFDSEGLTLFTKANGTIPANTPAGYAGFAHDMVVNPAIVDDRTLIRKGTNPASTVQEGSGEVLRKIIEFTFGNTEYQEALGDEDISNPVPTLFTTLGLTGQARLVGDKNVQALGALEDSPFINPGTQDTFTLQVGAGLPQTITITAGMTASTLVTAINAAFPGMAQLGTGGELILTANDTLTIGAGTLGSVGLEELGLEAGVTAASPPSFQIAVGNNNLSTITVTSTDTSTTLLAKLNALVGVDASLTADGYLRIVPEEGGDITLIDGLAAPLAALGIVVTDIPHASFNVNNLGPGANLNGSIQNSKSLMDYSTQMVSNQAQAASINQTALTTETNYKSALEKQVLDTSGVNLDEEMAQLITIQTAYSASARTISVVQQMLDQLFQAVG